MAIPLHTHNAEESVLVLEGEAAAITGDAQHDLQPNDIIWIPRNVPHSSINGGSGQKRIFQVYAGARKRTAIMAAPPKPRWAARRPGRRVFQQPEEVM